MTTANQPKHTLARLIGRFASGRDLDGQRRTNATFLRHADRDLTPHGRAGRWAHRRQAERAAYRIGGLTFTLASLYGLLAARSLTLVMLALSFVTGFVIGIWRIVVTFKTWRHIRGIVSPLYMTLAPLTGHPPGDHHGRYIKVPRNFQNDDAIVRLNLSPKWEGTVTQQKAVSGLMARRLGGDWDTRWYQHAVPPYMEMRHAPSPPSRVTFADFQPVMERCPPNTIPLGFGSSRQLLTINLDDEAPHIALTMGTGAGKTSTMTLIIAYLINKGVERIDVINTKRTGYVWAKDLPGVFIHNTMPAQIEAIHNVRLRMESRYDALLTDDTITFPRHVLIIEEQNSWMSYAKQYWDDYRQELDSKIRGNTPKRNPAISDIGFILFQGRQACVNVVSIYQRMSANAAGGGDMRDQYGAKLIARSSPQSWKILVGTTPVPKEIKTTIRGRGIFIKGDEAHPIQLAYLTGDEARYFALASGRQPTVTGPGSPATESAERYSLREIADSNVIPISYGALRKAKQRDNRFPAASNGGYTTADIRAWYINRPSTRRAA